MEITKLLQFVIFATVRKQKVFIELGSFCSHKAVYLLKRVQLLAENKHKCFSVFMLISATTIRWF